MSSSASIFPTAKLLHTISTYHVKIGEKAAVNVKIYEDSTLSSCTCNDQNLALDPCTHIKFVLETLRAPSAPLKQVTTNNN
jgi:hypothetical protein